MPQRRLTQNVHQQTPDPQLLQISRDLDIEYLELRDHIVASSYFVSTSKHLRIRVDNWLNKLDTIIANITWKRNRNNYAKLIDLMCSCETVVEPFTALPPKGDVPKMDKHQINRIIDEVQRQVKLQKMQSRASEEVNILKNSQVKPNEFWSRVKSERDIGTKASFLSDQSSIFLANSMQNGDSKFGAKKIDLVFNHESQSSKNSDKKKYQFSSQDMISNSSKDKQNYTESNKFYVTNNSKDNEQQHRKRPKVNQRQPKHLSVKLNTQTHKVQLIRSPFVKEKTSQQKGEYHQSLNTDQFSDKNSRLEAFRDQHISVEYENQTLKTQYFEQDISLNPHKLQDLSFFSTDECDFSDQLSERCREKQGVLSQEYFGWRRNEIEKLKRQYIDHLDKQQSEQASLPKKLMVKTSAVKILPTYYQNQLRQQSYQQDFLDEPDQIFNGTNSFSIISDHQCHEQLLLSNTNQQQQGKAYSIQT